MAWNKGNQHPASKLCNGTGCNKRIENKQPGYVEYCSDCEEDAGKSWGKAARMSRGTGERTTEI